MQLWNSCATSCSSSSNCLKWLWTLTLNNYDRLFSPQDKNVRANGAYTLRHSNRFISDSIGHYAWATHCVDFVYLVNPLGISYWSRPRHSIDHPSTHFSWNSSLYRMDEWRSRKRYVWSSNSGPSIFSHFSLGSFAAGYQSRTYGGYVPAGSRFARNQSRAAIGVRVPVTHPWMMLLSWVFMIASIALYHDSLHRGQV